MKRNSGQSDLVIQDERGDEAVGPAASSDKTGSRTKPLIPFRSEYFAQDPLLAGEIENLPGRLPSYMGWDDLDFSYLGDDSGYFRFRGCWNRPLKVQGSVISDEPLLLLRLPLAGQARLAIPGSSDIVETADNYGLFIRPPYGECTIENSVGVTNDLISPIISRGRLRAMLDGQEVPKPLRALIDGSNTNWAASIAKSPSIQRIAAEIIASPYAGTMRSLYLQGKMFELVAGVVSDLSGTSTSIARTVGPDQRKALTARDILMAELAAPPDGENLARRVGLNQRRLNEVFRDIFGATVFQCLAQWRLQIARDLLVGSDLPIKQIADHVGYSHVNNFILAFSRYYREPPAKYRRHAIGRSGGSSRRS